MQYQELSLVTHEIRLLTVKPANDDAADIECSLDTVSLGNPPVYSALSYCWGDPTDTRPIAVDGNIFNATVNLYDALTVLRSKGVGQLWIDAICINQADPREKAQQISLMGPIFQQAREVIAWLGADDAEPEKVLEIVNEYNQATPEAVPSQLSLEPMGRFLRREYWSRLWIIQELVLALNLSLQFGTYTMSWEHFENTVTQILKAKIPPAEDISVYRNLDNLIRLRKEITGAYSGGRIPFIRALYRCSMAQATIPRDKMFGLFSLTTDYRDYVSVPTYLGTDDDLCTRMALHYIAMKKSLDLIALLGRGCERPAVEGVPSWSPEFHNLKGDTWYRQCMMLDESDKRPLSKDLDVKEDHFIERLMADIFGPSFMLAEFSIKVPDLFGQRFMAALETIALPAHVGDALVCEAIQVGGIAQLGCSYLDADMETGLEDDAPQSLPNPYKSVELLVLAIYETFFYRWESGWPRRRHLGYSSSKEYFLELLRVWRPGRQASFNTKTQAWVEVHRNFHFHGRTMQEWCQRKRATWRFMLARKDVAGAHISNKVKRKPRDTRVLTDLARVIELGMRLMVTTQGYLGWAPRHARKGDVLHVMKGCSVPVLLRPRPQGGWVMVGDTYISGGIMAGRAVKNMKGSWEKIMLY